MTFVVNHRNRHERFGSNMLQVTRGRERLIERLKQLWRRLFHETATRELLGYLSAMIFNSLVPIRRQHPSIRRTSSSLLMCVDLHWAEHHWRCCLHKQLFTFLQSFSAFLSLSEIKQACVNGCSDRQESRCSIYAQTERNKEGESDYGDNSFTETKLKQTELLDDVKALGGNIGKDALTLIEKVASTCQPYNGCTYLVERSLDAIPRSCS